MPEAREQLDSFLTSEKLLHEWSSENLIVVDVNHVVGVEFEKGFGQRVGGLLHRGRVRPG